MDVKNLVLISVIFSGCVYASTDRNQWNAHDDPYKNASAPSWEDLQGAKDYPGYPALQESTSGDEAYARKVQEELDRESALALQQEEYKKACSKKNKKNKENWFYALVEAVIDFFNQ